MGSSSSKGKQQAEAAKYGQIYVQTDKSAYYAGETVTGKIYLNLLLPYPGNQITLKLKGKESTHIVHHESSHDPGDHRSEEKLAEDKHDIIKISVPVYSWATLVPGQYAIPFGFLLPNGLPSSFFQEGYRYLAQVSYQLESTLEPNTKNHPKLKHKQPLAVRQLILTQQRDYETEITTNLKSCCCCGRGSNKLKVKFDKNCYLPGERANVIIKLDNTESASTNKEIEFALVQKLRVHADGEKIEKELIKVKRTIPGIPAGGQGDSSQIELLLPNFEGGNPRQSKISDLKSYLLSLKERDELLYPATRGKLITSNYHLKVSCPMSGCCTTTPTVELPIEILYPDIQFAPVSAPGNWAPENLERVNVSFGHANVQPYGLQVKGQVNPDSSLMMNQTTSTNYQSLSQHEQ